MEDSLFHSHTIQPLAFLGIEHQWLELNTEVIIDTWIALSIIGCIVIGCRFFLRRSDTLIGSLVITIFTSFKTLIEQSVSPWKERYYFFVTSLFIFIFICNALVLIPGLEEPTKDLNTTFALALISFLYVQKEMFCAHGFIGYLKEYFKTPCSVIPEHVTLAAIPFMLLRIIANILTALFTFPLEVLGKLANVLSLSLRLFGNIFGSSIMITMFRQAASGERVVGLLSSIAHYSIFASICAAPLLIIMITTISLILSFGFGILESLIQAFVFSVLTLTYINLAIKHETPSKHQEPIL